MLSEPDIDQDNFIYRLKEPLKEMIDPDFQLPAELMTKKVLTDSERQSIKHGTSYQRRNEDLLNLLIQKDKAGQLQFIAALRNASQEHVLNFILCKGGKHIVT